MKNFFANLFAQVAGAMAASQFVAIKAFAALPEPDPVPGLESGTGTEGIKEAIIKVITTVLDFILLIAVVYVIIAGIRLIVSGGDEGQKDKAKQTIIYVIVGIIVVLFARVIVTFVNNILSGN
jgi:succinate dehydrogenase/fumarate reductase cytochrome b subunit